MEIFNWFEFNAIMSERLLGHFSNLVERDKAEIFKEHLFLVDDNLVGISGMDKLIKINEINCKYKDEEIIISEVFEIPEEIKDYGKLEDIRSWVENISKQIYEKFLIECKKIKVEKDESIIFLFMKMMDLPPFPTYIPIEYGVDSHDKEKLNNIIKLNDNLYPGITWRGTIGSFLTRAIPPLLLAIDMLIFAYKVKNNE